MKFIPTIGLLIAFSLFISGCGEHVQSVLNPKSAEAREIARLWWVMFAVCGVVFIAVIWFMLRAIFVDERSHPPGGAMMFVIGGGIVLPAVVLVGFLIYSLKVSIMIARPHDGMTIEVVGYQWWWDVRYPESGVVIANEIYIPVGEKVRFDLRAHDVIHSFWVPNLHGKLDMLPEHTTTIWIQADEPGVWRGQCAEFCGTQHALMGFLVIALEREEFDQWEADRIAAASNASAVSGHGELLFFRHGCSECHAIRGTRAVSNIGPDLTHVGDRRTLGAAAIPNSRGNLAGWIANPQAIKPGNLMPPTHMDSEDLLILVDYLFSLEGGYE